jgi:DNA-directed RNA polymerase specialized sigma24 family protein
LARGNQDLAPLLRTEAAEMGYFVGFTDIEIASALGVTDRTLRRDWDRTRMLLETILGR